VISATRLRQILPVIVSAIIVAFAGHALLRAVRQIRLHDVLISMHQIPAVAVASAALLVLSVYGALALYEAITVRQIKAATGDGTAVVAGLTAAPIGHAVGWGALSGGAVRYRVYSHAGLRPLEIAKIAMLAAIPYAVGLSFVLGIALVTQADRASALLRVDAALARGAGLALLALHAFYITLVLRRREAVRIGTLMVTLPPPYLTAIQYAVGTIEVCCGCAVLYVLLPASAHAPPYVVFVAIYVLSVLTGLASSVPAGIGVFDAMLLFLLPQMPRAELAASVIVYRFLLEGVPLVIALGLFTLNELRCRNERLGRERAGKDC
jgi:uncharacterized membrane protein YbhN (UPF0104 family)